MKQMKLKINKACDLSSISVLPPHSRRSNVVAGGVESSSIYGRSSQLTASQMRSQQPQLSQQSFSQGISSQHGIYSQFSQNSQDDVLTNEKLGSQERENPLRRTSCLPPVSYQREETQMVASRTSTNLMRKWSGSEHKCQTSEELEHRMRTVETSVNRLGMIMDSIQSDIMQINKGTKEITLEMDGVRQKLINHDDLQQLMNKGQEDLKNRLEMGLKSLYDQLKQNVDQDNLAGILSLLSTVPEKMYHQMEKLQNVLHKDITREMQAMACSMMFSSQKQETAPVHKPQASSCRAMNTEALHIQQPQKAQFPYRTNNQPQKAHIVPKVEGQGWRSVKREGANSTLGIVNVRTNQKPSTQIDLEQGSRIVIESDEETYGFTNLLKEVGTEVDHKLIEEADEETARILRKARRRKRKYSNTIIIN